MVYDGTPYPRLISVIALDNLYIDLILLFNLMITKIVCVHIQQDWEIVRVLVMQHQVRLRYCNGQPIIYIGYHSLNVCFK